MKSNKKLDKLCASIYSSLTVIDIELFFCVLFFTLYARPYDEEVFNVHYPNYNYISSVYRYYVLKNLAFLLTHLIFLLDPM